MLNECILVRPAALFRESYIAALEEGFEANGRRSLPLEDIAQIGGNFDAHLAALDKDGLTQAQFGENTLPGVPSNMFWLVERGEFIGSISIRARIDTPVLAHYGGHIGYSIRPSRQGRGHGAHMLALALRLCRGMGLGLVRISCGEANLASRRVIEKNGGLLLRRCAQFPPFVTAPYLLFEIPLV